MRNDYRILTKIRESGLSHFSISTLMIGNIISEWIFINIYISKEIIVYIYLCMVTEIVIN